MENKKEGTILCESCIESADNATAFKEDLLNRFGSYLKEGSLDLRNNLSIQMDIYANLKYKKILDLKHSVNVDLKLKIEELENKLKAVDEPTEGNGDEKRLQKRIDSCRDYLVGCSKSDFSIESALIALGFNENGF